MSRIGNMPVAIPAAVEIDIADDNTVTVKGPKGSLTQRLSPRMRLQRDNGTILVERPDNQREHRSLHGLTRTLLNNMVVGVTDGYKRDLEIQGVGYRAALEAANSCCQSGSRTLCECPLLTACRMLSMETRACPLLALTSSWSVKRRHEYGVCVLLNRTKAKGSATLASKCAARRVRPARPSNSVGRQSRHVLTRSDSGCDESSAER